MAWGFEHAGCSVPGGGGDHGGRATWWGGRMQPKTHRDSLSCASISGTAAALVAAASSNPSRRRMTCKCKEITL